MQTQERWEGSKHLTTMSTSLGARRIDTNAPAHKHWLSTWGILVGYCVLIFVLSAQSNLQPPGLLWYSDTLAHFLEYAVLGWLWTRAVTSSRPTWTFMSVLLSVFLFTSGYGLSDEWHQYYVPGRQADLRDALMDTVGGVSGGIGCVLWLRWQADKASHLGRS